MSREFLFQHIQSEHVRDIYVTRKFMKNFGT